MKIIIAGAGAVGLHLAELLSIELHDLVLIDTDEHLLDQIRQRMDIMVVHGDAASPTVLMEAGVKQSDLCIAATTSEKTNLLVAIMAKQLGSHKTIARINNPEYLTWTQLQQFESLGIAALISPELLAAKEIYALLRKAAYFDWTAFESGRILVLGFDIKEDSDLIGRSLREISGRFNKLPFIVVAILRNQETIIPNGSTTLESGDYIYVSTNKKEEKKVKETFAIPERKIRQVMVIGNTSLSIQTAQLLEQDFKVKLLLSDGVLAEQASIKCPAASTLLVESFEAKYLKEEGLGNMDAFIAISNNLEANIVLGLIAKQLGVYKVIAKVNNEQYYGFSRGLGIDSIVNKKRLAANEIFRHIRRGNVASVVNLHDVEAELIEFVVAEGSRLDGLSLEQAGFPKHSIVTGVIRGDKGIIPRGDFVFQKEDKIVTLAANDSILSVEDLCCQ